MKIKEITLLLFLKVAVKKISALRILAFLFIQEENKAFENIVNLLYA